MRFRLRALILFVAAVAVLMGGGVEAAKTRQRWRYYHQRAAYHRERGREVQFLLEERQPIRAQGEKRALGQRELATQTNHKIESQEKRLVRGNREDEMTDRNQDSAANNRSLRAK